MIIKCEWENLPYLRNLGHHYQSLILASQVGRHVSWLEQKRFLKALQQVFLMLTRLKGLQKYRRVHPEQALDSGSKPEYLEKGTQKISKYFKRKVTNQLWDSSADYLGTVLPRVWVVQANSLGKRQCTHPWTRAQQKVDDAAKQHQQTQTSLPKNDSSRSSWTCFHRNKQVVCARKPTNLPQLKLFCKEEQAKLSPSLCAGLINIYRKRLVAAKAGHISFWRHGFTNLCHIQIFKTG